MNPGYQDPPKSAHITPLADTPLPDTTTYQIVVRDPKLWKPAILVTAALLLSAVFVGRKLDRIGEEINDPVPSSMLYPESPWQKATREVWASPENLIKTGNESAYIANDEGLWLIRGDQSFLVRPATQPSF